MTNNTYIKQLDPIQGLVDYVQDIKPYHTKIVDVMIEYVYNDDTTAVIKEDVNFAWGPTKFEACVIGGELVVPCNMVEGSAIQVGDTITINYVGGSPTGVVQVSEEVTGVTYTGEYTVLQFGSSPPFVVPATTTNVLVLDDVTGFFTFDIVSFDEESQIITVNGPATAEIFNGQRIRVSGTTSNDGDYTIEGSPTFNGLHTNLPVAESLIPEIIGEGSPTAVVSPVRWYIPCGTTPCGAVIVGCDTLTLWTEESYHYFGRDAGLDPSYVLGGWTTAMTPDGTKIFAGLGWAAAVDTVGITPGSNFDGSVAVLELVGNEYVQTTRFSHTDATGGARDDNFGASTSAGGSWFRNFHTRIIAPNADGTVVAVGAPDHIHSGGLQGAVYVFELVGSDYVQTQKITLADTYPSNGGVGFEGPPDSTTSGRAGFGHAVAMRGDGGPGSVIYTANPEAVFNQSPWLSYVGFTYAFTNVAGTWVNTQLVTTNDPLIPDDAGNDIFGDGNNIVISRDGNTLVTAMWHLWTGTFDAGDNVVAYKVYRWNAVNEEMELYAILRNETLPFSATSNGYSDIAISDDGTRIVTADSWLGLLEVWDDNGNGTFTRTEVDSSLNGIASCAICGSGDVLAYSRTQNTASADAGTVFVYKNILGTWTSMETFNAAIPPRPGAAWATNFGTWTFGWSMVMSQDGTILFASSPEWYDEIADNANQYTGAASTIIGTA